MAAVFEAQKEIPDKIAMLTKSTLALTYCAYCVTVLVMTCAAQDMTNETRKHAQKGFDLGSIGTTLQPMKT